MEARLGGILFTSKFDSGNLARIERVHGDDDDSGNHRIGDFTATPDYEFNLWTKPDCDGTEYQNGNRSWFHFAVKGCPMNKLVKFNIMNMNRQGKLYNQGMAPVVKVLPQKPRWERIRDRPVCETVDGQFIMAFTYRFEYRYSTVYFAFCYPFSYTECQNMLEELDQQFNHCQEAGTPSSLDSIYYHRELLCHSLDGLRVDLLTVSSYHGITDNHEPRLEKLFPDMTTTRARRFEGKRVYFLSSRVHPGETPASFVFNGFLDFILRSKDPRSQQLRRQYVFKMVPLLNPDGVQRGHYRTDQRGVNLNRMYTNPDFGFHPSVYAAKSIVIHHHKHSRVINEPNSEPAVDDSKSRASCQKSNGTSEDVQPATGEKKNCNSPLGVEQVDNDDMTSSNSKPNAITIVYEGNGSGSLGRTPQSSLEDFESSETDHGPRCRSSHSTVRTDSGPSERTVDVESDDDDDDLCHGMDKLSLLTTTATGTNSNNSNSVDSLSIPWHESGIAFYVDLHGHASKRGCFIYGNHLRDEEKQVENVLFPKLISLNSSHFDFDGCNFSEKNMYTKDKRDGMSKEGSGRVAMLKSTGIVHSYTLECNYNTGRFMNSLAPACMDDGRATPPQVAGFPPKYSIAHFEDVGRALAVAALDFTDSNPWSRIASTEYNSVHGIRAWVQRYLRSMRGAPSLPKKMSRVASKTSSLVATATSRHNLNMVSRPRLVAGDTRAVAFGRRVTPRPSGSPVKKSSVSKNLGPVRETKASIERKKKITSNQPTVSSNSKTKATHSVSSKSFEKPITPSLQNKSHPPGISSKQQDKDLVSLPLTHKPPNASLSIIRARSGSRIGRDQQTRGDQFVTKKIENVRNAKNLNEEKERAFEEDSSVVQGLLNHMVVQVLEQRPDSAMAGQFGLNREKSHLGSVNVLQRPHSAFALRNTYQHINRLTQWPMSKVVMQVPQMTTPLINPVGGGSTHHKDQSMFRSFIQRKNSNLQMRHGKTNNTKQEPAQSNVLPKHPKKSSVPKRRSLSHSPNRKQSHLIHKPKMKNQEQHSQSQEDKLYNTGYMDRIIQQRLLNSSLSDPHPGDSVYPNLTCKSLEPSPSSASLRSLHDMKRILKLVSPTPGTVHPRRLPALDKSW
ncbi:cytosolic carboxypeptidase-like protein 5 isoform X3 [Apostichopus japonicus]|uniref:cytosolic carboxypeptidase-like protein 5 isoform X3 n=1 Tax=Stichopus japonicus TaxID=307972 RepID=UPI003AB57BA3